MATATTSLFRSNTNAAAGESDGIARGINTVVMPNPYVVGGIEIAIGTDASLSNAPNDVTPQLMVTATGVVDVTNYAEYDYANQKIMVFVRATGVQAAAIDLSTLTCRLVWSASMV